MDSCRPKDFGRVRSGMSTNQWAAGSQIRARPMRSRRLAESRAPSVRRRPVTRRARDGHARTHGDTSKNLRISGHF